MMYRCSLCEIPCTLSIHGTPSNTCVNSKLDGLCAWVEIDGMFSTVVPA